MITPVFVAWLSIVFAQAPTSASFPTPTWIRTTPSHLTVRGTLAGQPISRDEVRGTALSRDRAFAVLIPPGHAGVRLLCLNRADGTEVWKRQWHDEYVPMLRELPIMDGRLFLALYRPSDRGVTIAAVDTGDGSLLWQRPLAIALRRYQYGDLLEADVGQRLLHLYLPETENDNRVTMSADGGRIRHLSYRGFFWPSGIRHHKGLLLTFEGEPLAMRPTAVMAVDETSGLVRWRMPTRGQWTSPPSMVDDMMVIALKDQLRAVDASTGRPQWTIELRGLVPPHPPPPAMVGERIVVAQYLAGTPPPYTDPIVTTHLPTTGLESGVVRFGKRLAGPVDLRRMGPLLVMGNDLWVDIIEPGIPALRRSTSFERTFSRFLFATPQLWVGSADERGFLVVTSDGKIRYYGVP